MSEMLISVFEAAKKCRERAYAPYSHYKVGAALKALGSEQIFAGCNVENSSYGATICAERNSVLKWVSETGGGGIEFMVLVTQTVAEPCGLCLQVLSEFCSPETKIFLADPFGVQKEVSFKQLLPHPFDKKRLSK